MNWDLKTRMENRNYILTKVTKVTKVIANYAAASSKTWPDHPLSSASYATVIKLVRIRWVSQNKQTHIYQLKKLFKIDAVS